MDYQQLLLALLPDLLVVVALFAALGVDYSRMRGSRLAERFQVACQISAAGLIAGLAVILVQLTQASSFKALASITDGQLVLNTSTLTLKALLYAMGLGVLPLAKRDQITPQVSEYFALLLLATLGMGFVVTSRNLLGAFVALEMVSLSLYAMTVLNQAKRASAEAALKYLTFGAVASGFLLFGLSYLYGATGQLDLTKMTALSDEPMLVLAYLLIFVGLGFKLALVPFHLWAPDVYQNAPTPVAGWIGSGSKIAAAALLIALLKPVSSTLKDALIPALAVLALLSMVVGNLGALRQTNLKRLLAYSAIANAGYLLVGVVAFSEPGNTSVIFYILVYSLASLGAFGVVAVLTDTLGRDAEISDFNGCWTKTPGLAVAFLVFVLSLAGIPPLAGFLGKFYLFYAAIEAAPEAASWHDGFYWLVAFALIMSVVSLYYYLRVLKAFLVAPSDDGKAASIAPIKIGWAAGVTLCLLAIAVLALGLWPEPLLNLLSD
jgi:NADH-quinone oxidoreductase subunit N